MKTLRFILCMLLLAALLLSLVSCKSRVDKIEKKLTKEGFTITRYGQGAANASLELSVADGVITELRATRESEWLKVKEFVEEDTAELYCNAWKDAYELAPNMIAVREGTVVFYGVRSVYELIE